MESGIFEDKWLASLSSVFRQESTALEDIAKQNFAQVTSQMNLLQIVFERAKNATLNIKSPELESIVTGGYKRLIECRQIMQSLPANPAERYRNKNPMGKIRKLTPPLEQYLFKQDLFLCILIIQVISECGRFVEQLKIQIDTAKEIGSPASIANAVLASKILQDCFRLMQFLIQKLQILSLDTPVFSEKVFEKFSKRPLTGQQLREILFPNQDHDKIIQIISEKTLKLLTTIMQTHRSEEFYPFVEFYRQIRDESPDLEVMPAEVELALLNLAKSRYFAGIKPIPVGKNQSIKMLQLRLRNISYDENAIIIKAYDLQPFILDEIIHAMNWPKEKVRPILDTLTKIGILRYSNNLKMGECWYMLITTE
jgi:hypothetical protein